MGGRRRRLGKYAAVCFAEPPWNEEHPDWIRLDEDLPADHAARLLVDVMRVLDLTPLFDSYSAGGTFPIRPDLMLRLVLIEMQQGRYRPSQWFRDVREHTPLMWAAFGIRPSRTACYEFADRVAPWLAERQRPQRRRSPEKIVVSASDPEAALGRDKLKVFRPLYNVQLVRDLDSSLVLAYDVFPQAGDEATLKPMLDRLRRTFDVRLDTLLTDAGYITSCNVALCQLCGLTLYGPWQENDYSGRKQKGKAKFSKDRFQWLPDENAYQCPQGHRLTPIGKERRPQSDGEIQTVYRYRCLPAHCRDCPLRDACTTNPARGCSLRRSEHEDLIDAHKARMQSDEGKALYKLRRQTVELGFADLKEHRNLQRFSGRGLDRVKRQLALTVLAHNLTVLARHPALQPQAADSG